MYYSLSGTMLSIRSPKVSHKDKVMLTNHTHFYILPWNYFIVTSCVCVKSSNQFRTGVVSTLRILGDISLGKAHVVGSHSLPGHMSSPLMLWRLEQRDGFYLHVGLRIPHETYFEKSQLISFVGPSLSTALLCPTRAGPLKSPATL